MENEQQTSRENDLKRKGDAYLLPGRIEKVEREQAEAKKRDEEYKDRQLELEGRLVRLTFWLVVVGLLGTGISVWNSSISRRSALVAEDAAVAATTAARATENQLVLQLGQLDLAREQLAAQERARLAEEAAYRRDNRARMNINQTGFSVEGPYENGDPVTIEPSVQFVNRGKNPAYNFAAVVDAVIAPLRPQFVPQAFPQIPSSIKRDTVEPGQGFSPTAKPRIQRVSLSDFVRNGLHIYGTFSYDSLGVTYTHRFCLTYTDRGAQEGKATGFGLFGACAGDGQEDQAPQ